MYPKKQPKSDREKFYGAFQKKVGCKPEQYLRRKLAGGMQEAELRRLYDMLAVEIAMKARCTAIRYDALQLDPSILKRRIVACETGSDVSPPGGETAPMAVTLPCRLSLPRQVTQPARS